MRKLVIAGLSVFALSLSACTGAPVENTAGRVVEKDYDPTTYKTVKDCKTVSGKKTCKNVQKISEYENWDITVRPDGANTDGSQDVEINVSREVFDGCELGNYFNGKTCSLM